jgi:protein-S-isoprenylcysteine O-methyltransferase Ste14
VILGGVAIRIAPAPHTWPVVANVLFLFGGALAIASLATLGRSFSVLPALRDVVSRGPYRVVRHPAYVGELVLVIGAAFARYDWIGVAILVAAVVTVALRVLAEERLLTSDEAYRAYTSQVRYRLLPFVW